MYWKNSNFSVISHHRKKFDPSNLMCFRKLFIYPTVSSDTSLFSHEILPFYPGSFIETIKLCLYIISRYCMLVSGIWENIHPRKNYSTRRQPSGIIFPRVNIFPYSTNLKHAIFTLSCRKSLEIKCLLACNKIHNNKQL